MSYVNTLKAERSAGELYSDHAVPNAAKIKLFCFSPRSSRLRRTQRNTARPGHGPRVVSSRNNQYYWFPLSNPPSLAKSVCLFGSMVLKRIGYQGLSRLNCLAASDPPMSAERDDDIPTHVLLVNRNCLTSSFRRVCLQLPQQEQQ